MKLITQDTEEGNNGQTAMALGTKKDFLLPFKIHQKLSQTVHILKNAVCMGGYFRKDLEIIKNQNHEDSEKIQNFKSVERPRFKCKRASKTAFMPRRKRTFLYMVLITFTLLTVVNRIECSVTTNWKLTSKPAIIGNNITLECLISVDEGRCDRLTRQWYGGKKYGLLCEDGMCRNPTKYREIMTSNCTYTLSINNFGMEDLNQSYTCSYGVVNDRKGLVLNKYDFELRPNNSTMKIEILVTNDTLTVHLNFTMTFPEPICSFIYQDINITDRVSKKLETKDMFYASKFNIEYSLQQNCKGDFVITCDVGSYKMNVSNTSIDTCLGGNPTNDTESQTNVTLVSIIIVMVSTAVFICIFLVFFYIRKRTNSRLEQEIPMMSKC